jgi:hypothetical protein
MVEYLCMRMGPAAVVRARVVLPGALGLPWAVNKEKHPVECIPVRVYSECTRETNGRLTSLDVQAFSG